MNIYANSILNNKAIEVLVDSKIGLSTWHCRYSYTLSFGAVVFDTIPKIITKRLNPTNQKP